ncbi:MMPL family transporter [Streptomyces sp. NBRC 110028]|uniref:MMPL family transporter n=1 Tax=Streptomyces sp. NBRC 110028 TaxID=1621260 RepID=UPI0006E1295A|nr:MMPL family transporter [Streptomyces sp. NBRC 110028]
MTPHTSPPPLTGGFAARISRAIGKARWPLLALWLVALAVSGLGASSIADSLSGGGWYVSGSDSDKAARQLEHGFKGRGKTTVTLVIHDKAHKTDSPRFEERALDVTRYVQGDKTLKVTDVSGWTTLDAENRSPYAGDDHRTVTDSLALDLDDGAARRELPKVQEDLTDRFEAKGLEVSLVSPSSFWGEVNTLSQEGLTKAELITMPLIIVILLLLFRSVAAALVSLAVGVSAIVFTLGLLAPISQHYELSVFVENAATMLGLGVGVDYSLFMITRFKEQLAKGQSVETAVAATLRTSGHTVIASGVTIVLAMCTLFLIDLNVIFSLALGATVVVAFSVLTAVVFLPVLLHILGNRINAGRIRLPRRRPDADAGAASAVAGEESSRWYRIALKVMARPVLFLGATSIALLALAAPAAQLRTFSPDARILPGTSQVRVGYDHVQDAFGVGTTSPLQVVITSKSPLETSAQAQELTGFSNRLEELPHVDRVDSALPALKAVSPKAPFTALADPVMNRLPDDAHDTIRHYVAGDNRTVVFEVVPDTKASSDAARSLLHRVQDEADKLPASLDAVIGGETAEGLDANDVIQDGLPIVIMVMLAAVYVVLLLTFRSLLLPLKAIAMNLLSIAATYGVLVLVFQRGMGTDLLNFEQTNYLQNFVPVLLLALLFSLSTDYEVFLLDRVREEYLATGDNTESVARGLTRTAPLISGAALLMVAVFGAFGFAGIVPIQQLGFGMAVAIILDATLVRLLLVPASMRLMGRWNWWLPGRRPAPRPQEPAAPSADPQPERETAMR